MERPGTASIASEYAPAQRGEWTHFLYGHVPQHKQDYILVPSENPAALTEQHIAYLGEPLKYLEPLQAGSYALAFVNLAAGSAQRGALALVLSVRVGGGVRDAKNRPHPVLTHAIAAAERDFAGGALLRAAESLRASLIGSDPGLRPVDVWYSDYALRFNELVADPDARSTFFADYLRRFERLPLPPARRDPTPLRSYRGVAAADSIICVRHGETVPPDELLPHAARIAGLLCTSEIGWSQITVGAAPRTQNTLSSAGLQVVFLPERVKLPVGQSALELSVLDLPEDPTELARALGLQARPRESAGPALSVRSEPSARPAVFDATPLAGSGGSANPDPAGGDEQTAAPVNEAPLRTWLATPATSSLQSSPYASSPEILGARRWVLAAIIVALLCFAAGAIVGKRWRPATPPPLPPPPVAAQAPRCEYACTCEPPDASVDLRGRTFLGRVRASATGCPEPRCLCSFPQSAAAILPSVPSSAPCRVERPQAEPPPGPKRRGEAHQPPRSQLPPVRNQPPGSVGNPPSSVGNPPGSVVNPPGSVVNPPGSVVNPPGSVGNPPGSVGNPPGSVPTSRPVPSASKDPVLPAPRDPIN